MEGVVKEVDSLATFQIRANPDYKNVPVYIEL